MLASFKNALIHYYVALPLAQHTEDRDFEATILRRTSLVYSTLGAKQEALDHDNRALLIYRTAGDRAPEATMLNSIGKM